MDAGWFWAVLMSIPALIALVEGYGEEALLAASVGALAIIGGTIAWPLGLAVALGGRHDPPRARTAQRPARHGAAASGHHAAPQAAGRGQRRSPPHSLGRLARYRSKAR
jgi:hypothetical protein